MKTTNLVGTVFDPSHLSRWIHSRNGLFLAIVAARLSQQQITPLLKEQEMTTIQQAFMPMVEDMRRMQNLQALVDWTNREVERMCGISPNLLEMNAWQSRTSGQPWKFPMSAQSDSDRIEQAINRQVERPTSTTPALPETDKALPQLGTKARPHPPLGGVQSMAVPTRSGRTTLTVDRY
jgi:hypothetical protein